MDEGLGLDLKKALELPWIKLTSGWLNLTLSGAVEEILHKLRIGLSLKSNQF